MKNLSAGDCCLSSRKCPLDQILIESQEQYSTNKPCMALMSTPDPALFRFIAPDIAKWLLFYIKYCCHFKKKLKQMILYINDVFLSSVRCTWLTFRQSSDSSSKLFFICLKTEIVSKQLTDITLIHKYFISSLLSVLQPRWPTLDHIVFQDFENTL